MKIWVLKDLSKRRVITPLKKPFENVEPFLFIFFNL